MRCPVLALVCFVAVESAWGGGSGLSAEVQKVLGRVPDDARLVIVVPSLERLEKGLTAFGSAAGAPALTGLRAEFILGRLLGRRAGALQPNGPLALALVGPEQGPVLIGLRSLDTAWTDVEPTETLDDGSKLYELGERGWFAAAPDGTAAIAREKNSVAGALGTTRAFAAALTKPVRAMLLGSEIVLFADLPAWRPALQRQLRRVAVNACMGTALVGPDAEVGAQAVTWFLEQAERLLGDARGYALALHFSERGLHARDRLDFALDGVVSEYLRALRKPPRDLLRGLPSGDSAVIFSAEWNVASGTPSINEALVGILRRMGTLRAKVGPEVFDAALRESIEAHRHMSGYSGMISVTENGTHVTYAGLYLTPTGAEVQRNVRTVCELCPELMSAWGTSASAQLDYEREHVGKVEADVYRYRVTTSNLQSPPVLQAFYGENSALYMAPHPEGVAYAMAPRAAARDLIKRLLADTAPPLHRDHRVRALLKQLSPNPQVCLLVDVPEAFKLIAALAADMGLSLPTLGARDAAAPLAGYTVYLDASAIRSELFLPSQPIRILLEAFAKQSSTRPAPASRPARN